MIRDKLAVLDVKLVKKVKIIHRPRDNGSIFELLDLKTKEIIKQAYVRHLKLTHKTIVQMVDIIFINMENKY
jgi:hypothetical protein